MTLRLNGDGSGFTEIKAADAAGDNSIKLPASNGSANQLLKNGSTAGELEYSGGIYSDSDNVLLIGKPTTGSALTNGVELHSDVNSALNQPALQVFSYTDTDALRTTWTSYLQLNKSRAAQPGENGAVALSDYQGMVRYSGDDGTNFVPGSEIFSVVEGAVGTNVMPSKLVFATNGGAASTTPRVEIGSNGALKLLAGCPGIDFSGIQTNAAGMSSEMLDSYEEGTWTPSIGGNTTYNIQQGTYVRVGRLVMINYYISIDNHGTGSARTVSGLPFTAAATTGGGAVAYFANLQQNISYLSGYIYNGTTINFYGNATPDNNLSSSVSVFRGGAAVQGSNVYMAA